MAAVGGAGDGRPSTAMQVDDAGEWPPLSAGVGCGRGEAKTSGSSGTKSPHQLRDGGCPRPSGGSNSSEPKVQRRSGMKNEAAVNMGAAGQMVAVLRTAEDGSQAGSGTDFSMDFAMADYGEDELRCLQELGRGSEYPMALCAAAHGRSGLSPEAAGTMEANRSGEGKMPCSTVLKACAPPYVRVEAECAAPTQRRGARDDLERCTTLPNSSRMQGICHNAEGRLSADPGLTKRWAERLDAQEHFANDICMGDNVQTSNEAAMEGSSGGLREGRKQHTAYSGGSDPGIKVVGNGNSKGMAKNAWTRPQVIPLSPRDELGDLTKDGITLQLDEKDVQATIQQFEGAIVGRLFGRRLPFSFLNTELKKRWEKFGYFRIITIGSDCFVCLFDNREVRDSVLMGGPWIVAGQVLGLDKWSPSFSPASLEGFITPVWVRLPNLPLYCWGSRNLSRIAAIIGEPMWADATTHRLERGSFARVCVRVDLSKALTPGIWIQGLNGRFFQPVVYEGLSLFCFRCGHVGHRENHCTNKSPEVQEEAIPLSQPAPMEQQEEATVMENSMCSSLAEAVEGQNGSKGFVGAQGGALLVKEDDPTTSLHGYGPWMVVTRKPRPNKGPRPSRHSGGDPTTSATGDTRSSPREGPQEQMIRPPHIREETSPQQEEELPSSERPPNTSFFPLVDEVLANVHHGRGNTSPPAHAGCSGMEMVAASPSHIPISPHVGTPGGRRRRRKREGPSQKFIERLVSNLGPTTVGVRKKKKASIFAGGDASPLRDS